jgi:hypothetical protein
MVRKLAEYDRNVQNIEIKASQDRNEREVNKQQDIKDALLAKRARKKARKELNNAKEYKREHGEDTSSNHPDTDAVEEQDRIHAQKLAVTGGYALSDVTWEDTSTESTIWSRSLPIGLDYRLRSFEWPYITMPSLDRPQLEQYPMKLTYAPL